MASNTPTITEADFQRRVIDLARVLGYRVAHFRPARTAKGWRTALTGNPGWPDLVLLKQGRLILAELKSEKGKLAPDQAQWLAELSMVPGVLSVTWRPSDWPIVVETLTGRMAA